MASPSSARASVLRTRNEISQELQGLLDGREKVVAFLSGGELLFDSVLARIDAAANRIVLEPSSAAEANDALLAQPRCILNASSDGWRIEFVAAAPRREPDGGIALEFPEVLTRWKRAHDRSSVEPGVPLHVTADSEGLMPFEGLVVDIGPEGLGFLIHEESITLEPGTLLRSCLVDLPGQAPCKVDLEVCYSQPIVLGDGTHSVRSGCRFVDTGGQARELVRFYLERQAPAEDDKQDLLP